MPPILYYIQSGLWLGDSNTRSKPNFVSLVYVQGFCPAAKWQTRSQVLCCLKQILFQDCPIISFMHLTISSIRAAELSLSESFALRWTLFTLLDWLDLRGVNTIARFSDINYFNFFKICIIFHIFHYELWCNTKKKQWGFLL